MFLLLKSLQKEKSKSTTLKGLALKVKHNMKEILERFYGVWFDKNGNLLFIKPGNMNEVKVSFASGRTKAPV